MTPETLDLISGVIEEIIAAIPQIVVVLTTVVYSLNAIKARVSTYPKIASDTKEEVNNSLAGMKGKIEGILNVSKEQINTMLVESKESLLNLVNEANKIAQEKTNTTLNIVEKDLAGYKAQLISSIDQTNLLVRQNKLFMDVILNLVAQDPNKVSAGITQEVSTKINLTKEELEKYPQLLVQDITVLESALKEAYKVIGEDAFKALLEKVGYGKTND